jgi:malonyl-CoA decarboxylase
MGLLRQFSALPNGVKFLVDMRAEVRETKGDDQSLVALDADLKELLSSWFNVGLLNLQRITWNAPAALLEKLTNYEAVHAIRSWQDLKTPTGFGGSPILCLFSPQYGRRTADLC